jgi:hypothetical protein
MAGTSSMGQEEAAAPGAAAGAAATVDEAVAFLASVLPACLQPHLQQYLLASCQPALAEVVLDSGRQVELRLSNGSRQQLPLTCSMAEALQQLVTAKRRVAGAVEEEGEGAEGRGGGGGGAEAEGWQQAAGAQAAGAAPAPAGLFNSDNRLALPGSLHRISAMRNTSAARAVYGLTYRVGRHVPGAAGAIRDVLWQMVANR